MGCNMLDIIIIKFGKLHLKMVIFFIQKQFADARRHFSGTGCFQMQINVSHYDHCHQTLDGCIMIVVSEWLFVSEGA